MRGTWGGDTPSPVEFNTDGTAGLNCKYEGSSCQTRHFLILYSTSTFTDIYIYLYFNIFIITTPPSSFLKILPSHNMLDQYNFI